MFNVYVSANGDATLFSETQKYSKLKGLAWYLQQLFVQGQVQKIEQVMQWLEISFLQVAKFITENKQDRLLNEDCKKITNLLSSMAIFAADEKKKKNKDFSQGVTSCCIMFSKSSVLRAGSGIKFFRDPQGKELIKQIQADKESKIKINPIIFKSNKNIYCQYYYNANSLPIYMQQQGDSQAEVTVFGIPKQWSVVCWVFEVLSKMLSFEANQGKSEVSMILPLVQSLHKIIVRTLEKLQYPEILRTTLFKLLTRSIRCWRRVLFKIPDPDSIFQINNPKQSEMYFELQGIEKSFIVATLKDAISHQKNQEDQAQVLYNAYPAEMTEFIAIILSTFSKNPNYLLLPGSLITEIEIPQWLLQYIDLIEIMNYFKNQSLLPNKIESECLRNLNIATQFNSVVYITNLPFRWTVNTIKTVIKSIVKKNYGRILNTEEDIYVPVNKQGVHCGDCILLLDGQNSDIFFAIQEEQKQEENKQHPAEPAPMTWNCIGCTYENPIEINICEMCQTPRIEDFGQDIVEQLNQHPPKNMQDDFTQEQILQSSQVNQFLQGIKSDLKMFITAYNLKQQNQKEQQEQQNLLNFLLETLIDNVFSENKSYDQNGKKFETMQLTLWNQTFNVEIIDQKDKKEKEINILCGLNEIQKEQREFMVLKLYLLQRIVRQNQIVSSYLQTIEQIFRIFLNQPKIIQPQDPLYRFFQNCQNCDQFIKNIIKTLSISNVLELYYLFECFGFDLYGQKVIPQESEIKLLSFEQLILLKHLIETMICKESKFGLNYPSSLIRIIDFNNENYWNYEINEINFMPYQLLLNNNKLSDIRFNWELIKQFNQKLENCIEMINIEKKEITNNDLSISNFLRTLHQLWLGSQKRNFIQRVLQKTAIPRVAPPKIIVNRMKIFDKIANSENHLIINQTFDQIYMLPSRQLRPIKPRGANPFISFEVVFKEEFVEGEGGPYRQYFSDVSAELSNTDNFGVLEKNENGKLRILKKNIQNKDNWWQVLGVLIGCGMRTGAHFEVVFEDEFWKELSGQTPCCSQIGEIKRGILKIIPEPLLSLVTPSELELWVCSKPQVNFALLKRNTQYDGGLLADSQIIQWFWQEINLFNEEDKLNQQRFVKFCWGQERLPANDEEFERAHTRFMIKPAEYASTNPDKAFPKADTCFFNLKLPNYSSPQILRERILLAICTDCQSMNADKMALNQQNPSWMFSNQGSLNINRESYYDRLR